MCGIMAENHASARGEAVHNHGMDERTPCGTRFWRVRSIRHFGKAYEAFGGTPGGPPIGATDVTDGACTMKLAGGE